MSVVTDVILTTAIDDWGFAKLCTALPTGVRSGVPLQPPRPVHQLGSTGKSMQANVYIAAYNYLNLDELVAAMSGLLGTCPKKVRLFVNGEYDENGFHEVLLQLPGERRAERT